MSFRRPTMPDPAMSPSSSFVDENGSVGTPQRSPQVRKDLLCLVYNVLGCLSAAMYLYMHMYLYVMYSTCMCRMYMYMYSTCVYM